MKTAVILLLLSYLPIYLGISAGSRERSRELIKYVNNDKESTWQAKSNPIAVMKEKSMKKLCGTMKKRAKVLAKTVLSSTLTSTPQIPLSFDARSRWPNCKSIGLVRNQGNCGSCWAFSAAQVYSDRMCITTGSTVIFSPENLLTCCTSCGYGCDGGYPDEAYIYWTSTGVVSGGDFGTNIGCQPYSSEAYLAGTTPPCATQCVNTTLNYTSDLRRGRSWVLIPQNVTAIQLEILLYGPVTGIMGVNEDFLHFADGIYKYKVGSYLGEHAIKIIGWSVNNSVPYWICVNSWGTSWGMKGLFNILRGTNEVGIESYVLAGRI